MVIVVKVPVENSNDALGCRKAPNEIIANLDDIYISESGRAAVKEKLNIIDFKVSSKKNNESEEIIYKKALDLISTNDEKCVFIGGDHSISYSLAKAFLDVCNAGDKDPFLIVFDAHPDCKLISDAGFEVNNVSWLRKLIEGGFPKDKVIIIGLRSSSKEENAFLAENNILTYQMKNILDFHEICDIVMELANKHQIYVSIDIDAVDSVFVPGTFRGEPGGFTSRQLIYFIQRLNLLKTAKVFDITEINPDRDFNDVTVKLGAKLLGEIIS